MSLLNQSLHSSIKHIITFIVPIPGQNDQIPRMTEIFSKIAQFANDVGEYHHFGTRFHKY